MTAYSPPPSPVKKRGRPKGSLDSRKRKSNDQYYDNIHAKKSRKHAIILQQHNGYSCGVFVAATAAAIVSSEPIPLHVNGFRYPMAKRIIEAVQGEPPGSPCAGFEDSHSEVEGHYEENLTGFVCNTC